MDSIIGRWGNSSGVRLPKRVLEEAMLKINDPVDIFAEGETIIIRRKKKARTLDELFAGYEGGYIFEEADWGKPEGSEIW